MKYISALLYAFSFTVLEIRISRCKEVNSSEGRAKCSPCLGFQNKQILDCGCDAKTVEGAVRSFFGPILANLTSRRFFRYFRVDLETPCPFWEEQGQCVMEGCSVCACNDDEVPSAWLMADKAKDVHAVSMSANGAEYGWISGNAGGLSSHKLQSLERNSFNRSSPPPSKQKISHSPAEQQHGYVSDHAMYLRETEDDESDDWIDMSEQSEHGLCKSRIVAGVHASGGATVYVNLLDNPERFTGYAGPSARRVWDSIWQENCFGGQDDTCVEKRAFYRLLSGLQASITTHIAKGYYFADENRWGQNLDLFHRAVGSHESRLNNLYFTFLFVLRAVVKASDYLGSYDYSTGDSEDDDATRRLVRSLLSQGVAAEIGQQASEAGALDRAGTLWREAMAGLLPDSTVGASDPMMASYVSTSLEQCRNGFDESILFQVPQTDILYSSSYHEAIAEKNELKEEFRMRFRNISRIMDCVTCEKCRVWGKLQILGLGTAIKVLLTPPELLVASAAVARGSEQQQQVQGGAGEVIQGQGREEKKLCGMCGSEGPKAKAKHRNLLTRQEVIALLNTLHQLSRSVGFAAEAIKAAEELQFPESSQSPKYRTLTTASMSGIYSAARNIVETFVEEDDAAKAQTLAVFTAGTISLAILFLMLRRLRAVMRATTAATTRKSHRP